jgi:hypothetical protein
MDMDEDSSRYDQEPTQHCPAGRVQESNADASAVQVQ